MLTLGSNPKWIAEQCGTSVQLLQEHYGRYIRSDDNALLHAYVNEQSRPKIGVAKSKTGTFTSTPWAGFAKYVSDMVVPTGIEPVFPT